MHFCISLPIVIPIIDSNNGDSFYLQVTWRELASRQNIFHTFLSMNVRVLSKRWPWYPLLVRLILSYYRSSISISFYLFFVGCTVSGLCTSVNKVHANIVLAGDPKQLDAVTKSEQAKELGFRTSFLEHLCEHQLYKRNEETKQFNEIYVSVLSWQNEWFTLNVYDNFMQKYHVLISHTDHTVGSKLSQPSKHFENVQWIVLRQLFDTVGIRRLD